MRKRGRRREGQRQHVHQRATYRTLVSHCSALFLLPSFLFPFSLLCFLFFCFYFYFFSIFTTFFHSWFIPSLSSYSLLSSSSPAVLPPFVPALHTEDDTSNFEEPEQAAPRPASAAQRGAQPAGFQGQDLPFLGWFFSRTLTVLAKTE